MSGRHADADAGELAGRLIGWREWVGLADFALPAIRAKIDTGARSSSLHVEHSEILRRDGIEWVQFGLRPKRHAPIRLCQAPVHDRRPVTDSGGRRTERVFIRTVLRLGREAYPIELNLTARHQMLFPMLIGRTALAGRWVVDPAGSFLCGRPRRDG